MNEHLQHPCRVHGWGVARKDTQDFMMLKPLVRISCQALMVTYVRKSYRVRACGSRVKQLQDLQPLASYGNQKPKAVHSQMVQQLGGR